MTRIHATALVDKKAQIHETVEIGAYTIIGPDVTIDEGTIVGNHIGIKGHTTIGKNNKIFQFASLGEAPQDKKYNGEATRLQIGDNNIIREFTTFHVGTVHGHEVTSIGNNNMFMVGCHIAHDCMIANNAIFANCVALGGHVQVKDWVVFGAYSIIHQFAIIGEHVMTAGGTGVAQDVPPYVLAFGYRAEPKGVNSEGLKRRGFSEQQIDNIKNAYRLLYRNDLSYSEARESISELALTQEELKPFLEFFNQSTRGIIR